MVEREEVIAEIRKNAGRSIAFSWNIYDDNALEMRAWKSFIIGRVELLDKVACVMMTCRDMLKDDPVLLRRNIVDEINGALPTAFLVAPYFPFDFIKLESKVHKSMIEPYYACGYAWWV